MEPGTNNTTESPTPEPPKRKYYIERSTSSEKFNKLTPKEKAAQVNRSMNIIVAWPNWEIWPFKISAPVLGAVGLIPGYILNSAFRNALLLGHYARASSYLATMGVPAALSGITHNLLISTDIVEQKTKCPVCLQVRSAALQLATGFLYPLVFVPIANFPTASGVKNLYFPKFYKEPKVVLSFVIEVFQTVRNRYVAVGMLQAVLAMALTHFQQECFANTLYPVLAGENDFSKETRKKDFFG